MLRSFVAAVAVLAPGLALAQDKPITVYFEPSRDQQLNNAIAVALSSPGLVQVLKPGPGVLIVSIPDKIDVDRGRISAPPGASRPISPETARPWARARKAATNTSCQTAPISL